MASGKRSYETDGRTTKNKYKRYKHILLHEEMRRTTDILVYYYNLTYEPSAHVNLKQLGKRKSG